MSEIAIVTEQLKRHEGCRLVPYDDATGKPIKPGTLVKGHVTIGIGRNLEARPISEQDAEELLIEDIDSTVSEIKGNRYLAEIYRGLNEYRKSVLINMCFNMGLKSLLGFKNTLALIRVGAFERAADNMLMSQWANQVGNRAKELAKIMKMGYA
jgi:lysozyme